jgi:hypothetical protein
MVSLRDIVTNEESIEQKHVLRLIEAGQAIDLLLQHKVDDAGMNQYYLYVEYRNHLRAVFTQRNTHRCYNNLDRAVEWGSRIGFASVSLHLDYKKYKETT